MEVEGGIYGQYSQILVRRSISEKKSDEAAATQYLDGIFRLSTYVSSELKGKSQRTSSSQKKI
jgi:negative regulator of sigma E activity